MNRLHLGYTWHGDTATWNKRLDVVKPHDLVVLNPSNGPVFDDMEELEGVRARIRQLHTKGAAVFGYVHLDQAGRTARRPWDDVFSDIRNWLINYQVNRIFFDELPASTSATQIRCWHGACAALGAPNDGSIIAIFNPGMPLLKPVTKLPRSLAVVTFEGNYADFPHRTWAPWEAAISYGAPLGSGLIPDGPNLQAVTSDSTPNPFDEVF